MNADDADAVDFMEIASHLGYLGYSVTPPPDGSRWYCASHANHWTFGFTRWRGFLWLRCGVALSANEAADSIATLERVNNHQRMARVTKFHVARDSAGQVSIEATAFLPFTYERAAFGTRMLQWIQETSRISLPASKQGMQSGR